MSYNPGPNLDPTNPILNGCPTPLKFVLCLSIKDFITGSNVSLDKPEVLKRLSQI